jgi:hypothetical protein
MAERDCFLEPPTFLLEAIDQIDAAANLLLSGEVGKARARLRFCDRHEIKEYIDLVAGPTNPDIHRFKSVPGSPPVEKNSQRMPSAANQRRLFERDGWRCRFCGVRVMLRASIKVFDAACPDEIRWTGPQSLQHPAFRACCASADHIVPHSRGGSNDNDNLVTACGPCQFGRNQWLLEEVSLSDPRQRPPIIDGWDGLTRLIVGQAN